MDDAGGIVGAACPPSQAKLGIASAIAEAAGSRSVFPWVIGFAELLRGTSETDSL
jgi:hypothetical protein